MLLQSCDELAFSVRQGQIVLLLHDRGKTHTLVRSSSTAAIYLR